MTNRDKEKYAATISKLKRDELPFALMQFSILKKISLDISLVFVQGYQSGYCSHSSLRMACRLSNF